jgi:hypothetical protein
MLTTSKYIMHRSSTRCAFCNQPLVPAMAVLNFGGPQTVSTSVQNFARTTLSKRGFEHSIPSRLQVLRPILPNSNRRVRKVTVDFFALTCSGGS